MHANKTLLAVGSDALLPVLHALRQQHWHIIHIHDPQQWKPQRSVTCSAGLLLLDGKLLRKSAALQQLASQLDLEWLLLTERAQLEQAAVRAFINDSCYDYHCLPTEDERLAVTLGRLHGKTLLRRRSQHEQVEQEAQQLVGEHPSIRRLRQEIRRLARVNVTVMITGESGTGKELVAQLIHQHSERADGPFQAVNCGGLPVNLVQSELFGHERGAFTGASSCRIGRIEAAQNGTLFLDEIGDMAIEAQVNLLRFLQEGTIDRLGDNRSRNIDTRVLSATHVDLPAAIAKGRFREDLYYRLCVCQLQLPALRERRSDIPLLAQYLLQQSASRHGIPLKRLSYEALAVMLQHDWPGNIREMSNRISQGLAMASGRVIRPQDMGLGSSMLPPLHNGLEAVRERAEREALTMALQLHHHNSSQAARTLGISRATLYRLLKKYEINAVE
ncbi:sigma-54 dependent transcriptional regulator [Aquitalea magnusonii]|uniref:DNA-binding NtrC family response regulator n=1 Tax=Aquitalea magnusonii TaxID=332411 RepID=A0A318JRW6_9NEIS|nr:sigma-54 dependent transcriptional regulator [Aquitalea magnusonii]PXX51246.1 DNA-binding NtrC family response regulator [Aquitalea magnusonii]